MLALHALQVADDIVHDALIDARVLRLAAKGAELIAAGKRGGRPSPHQRDINEVLIERARPGRRVLRLKGGDPFVFGRGWDEAAALTAAGMRFRIIPGLTSGLAAAALAGIPATSRDTNHAVVLAAGHRAEDGRSAADWEALAKLGQPLILYMPMAQLAEIAAALEQGGLSADTPAALIQSATHRGASEWSKARWRRWPPSAGEHGIGSPAIVVIGAIAGLRRRLLPAGRLAMTRGRAGSSWRRRVRAPARRPSRSACCAPSPAADLACSPSSAGRTISIRRFMPWLPAGRATISTPGRWRAARSPIWSSRSDGRRSGRRRRRDGPVRRRGRPGQTARGATADLAALLGWPVVLVLDVAGQTETAAAIAAGCARYRDDVASPA